MNRVQKGLSLIELMIALTLGSLLVLGLLKVFDASRVSYKLSEGLARVQENGRFAMDYLQRDLRMAGHMGCANDQARFLAPTPRFTSTFVSEEQPTEAQFDAAPEPLRFNTMLQGFEAAGTAPGAALSLASSGAWSGSPALPNYIATLTPAPAPGSDVIALRYFSAEGIPVTSFDGTRITVSTKRWSEVLSGGGIAEPGLLAIADCANASVFEATAVDKGGNDTTVQVSQSGLNRSSLANRAFTAGQATVYRAETQVYYVGFNPQARNEPTLYRARFTLAPGSGSASLVGGAPEALVEGVENMQLIYGLDSQTDQSRPPTGYIAHQAIASKVQPGNDTTPWRRVGTVQVAFLTRSTERAGVGNAERPEPPRLLGVAVTPSEDGRYRSVYESTVALRNRLYGN